MIFLADTVNEIAYQATGIGTVGEFPTDRIQELNTTVFPSTLDIRDERRQINLVESTTTFCSCKNTRRFLDRLF